ncbi:MAG: hypothetical protein PHX21_05050 [bacterium]|nr:hypothetical protein [bacterium]
MEDRKGWKWWVGVLFWTILMLMFCLVSLPSLDTFINKWSFLASNKEYIRMGIWGWIGISSLKETILFWERRDKFLYLSFQRIIFTIFAFIVAFTPKYYDTLVYLPIFLSCISFFINYLERKKNPERMRKYELAMSGATRSERKNSEYLDFVNENHDIEKICLYCDFGKITFSGKRICQIHKISKELNNTCNSFQIRHWSRIGVI